MKKRPKKISETLAIICLILNIIILPGLGSLIAKRTKEGTWQLVLLIGGFLIGKMLITTGMSSAVGLTLMIAGPLGAWIWAIVTGVQLVRESQ